MLQINQSPETKTHKHMRVTGENITISVGGFSISYNDKGPENGPPLIFIHGPSLNKNMWDLQSEALKNEYRVLSYDLRGHGNSTGDMSSLTIDCFREDLFNFMDYLHLDKVILCGISIGANIALEAVTAQQERFNAVIISGVLIQDEPKTTGKKAPLNILKSKGKEEYADASLKQFFSARSFTARKEEVRAVREMIRNTSPVSISSTARALADHQLKNIESIKLPTLILSGKEDALTDLSSAQKIQSRISGSTISTIDYSGHLANLENTHEFNGQLKKFVDGICKASLHHC